LNEWPELSVDGRRRYRSRDKQTRVHLLHIMHWPPCPNLYIESKEIVQHRTNAVRAAAACPHNTRHAFIYCCQCQSRLGHGRTVLRESAWLRRLLQTSTSSSFQRSLSRHDVTSVHLASSQAFIRFRLALLDEYPCIVDEIDKKLPSLTSQLQQLHLGHSTNGKFLLPQIMVS